MADLDRMETLRQFGFGLYASRAYLALLELGPSDARAISREAKIPAPKVYGTLSQLMQRGLARLLAETPRRYEPIPFGDFLEQQRTTHLEEAQRLGRVAATLAPLFHLKVKATPSDRGGVSVLRGRQTILRLHRQLASRVKHQLILIPSRGSARRASTFAALLADVAASGVRASVLLPRNGATPAILEMIRPLAEVRFLTPASGDVDSVTTACFDGRQVVLTHHVPDNDSAQDGHDVAIHINEEAIARSVHEGLAARWAAAEPEKNAKRKGSEQR